MLFGLLPARQIWQTDAARVMKGRSCPRSLPPIHAARSSPRVADCPLHPAGYRLAGCAARHAALAERADRLPAAGRDAGLPPICRWQATPTTLLCRCRKRMVTDALAAPGVTAAGDRQYPAAQRKWQHHLHLPGRNRAVRRLPTLRLGAKFFDISPGYLKAAENAPDGPAATLPGRTMRKSPKVAVINQTFARQNSSATHPRSANTS